MLLKLCYNFTFESAQFGVLSLFSSSFLGGLGAAVAVFKIEDSMI